MKKTVLTLVVLLYAIFPLSAHVIKYELDKMEPGAVFWEYLKQGFEHIIPLGLDHILFILCIFFINNNLKSIILQASMFTLAHSITLGLASYNLIQPPANVVEPLIALSIVFLAMENVFTATVKPWRMGMVFLFGLIHGMGFASVLSELGIPKYAFFNALLAFNIGVELGQVTIILVMYLLVARTFSKNVWYRRRIVIPASILIGIVAGYWTIERIL
jgi:hypothetical protein